MSRALALIADRPLPTVADLLRPVIVIGCGLALILAGPALPALGL